MARWIAFTVALVALASSVALMVLVDFSSGVLFSSASLLTAGRLLRSEELVRPTDAAWSVWRDPISKGVLSACFLASLVSLVAGREMLSLSWLMMSFVYGYWSGASRFFDAVEKLSDRSGEEGPSS